jgi:membrane protease YdiL (CAAX protease family)
MLTGTIFGIGFGLIINPPISKLTSVIINVVAWIILALLFTYFGGITTKKIEIKKKKNLGQFLVITTFLVLAIILASYLLKVELTSFAALYMFTPLTATLIIYYWHKLPLADLGISLEINKWFIVGWLLPVFLAFATLCVSLFFPGVEYVQQKDNIAIIKLLILGLLVGPTFNAIFAFGEELGWRGFMQKELASYGFWKSSFIIGLIWGIWHCPLIVQGHNYPQHPFLGVGMMIIFTILLSPLFMYIRIKSNSVISAAMMHGTLNAMAGFPLVFVKGNNLIIGVQGISGFVILIGLNILLFWVTKREKKNA